MGKTVRPTLLDYALQGAKIGVVESMQMALEQSADDPDCEHSPWVLQELGRCAAGGWAPKPCEVDLALPKKWGVL